MSAPLIGVLGLQGDIREHVRAVESAGARAVVVRRPEELGPVDGVVLPGGESTTMAKLAASFGVLQPLRKLVAGGLPAYGSCAGMILLADRMVDGAAGQETIGGLDVVVRRNAFGRQVDSFEADVPFAGLSTEEPVHAVFIRAPWVESAGEEVEVLARVPTDARADEAALGRIVAVRQGHLLATSFHPELTGDARVHELFVRMVRERVS
ncbi:MAG: pyridoxal 5'-phosphate synthase glutaminase subunit PdxT [Frankiaceae bacterium]